MRREPASFSQHTATRAQYADILVGAMQETGLCEVGGNTCYYAHTADQLRIDMRDIYARATRCENGARAGGGAAEGTHDR